MFGARMTMRLSDPTTVQDEIFARDRHVIIATARGGFHQSARATASTRVFQFHHDPLALFGAIALGDLGQCRAALLRAAGARCIVQQAVESTVLQLNILS